MPKINKTYFWAQFSKSEHNRRPVRYKHIFFKWSSQRAQKDAVKQKVLYLQEDGQKRKMVIKIEFTPLSDCKIVSVKGFK